MRHDAKLGLALGMLVIGFAVAFCFPRQPDRAVWSLTEVPAPIADSELDFLPVRAYQPTPRKTVPESSAVEEIPASGPPAGTLIGSVVAPAPIVPPREEVRLPLSAPPAGTSEPGQPRTGLNPPESKPSASRVYLVQPGDTLSGIATRVLGDSQRYLEIYEANKDRLANGPHDLRIGLELQLPSGQPALTESERRTDGGQSVESQPQQAHGEDEAQAR